MTRPYKLSALEGKVIAIDGPAGSGKSTTAKMVAARLGFTYLDTGAMYRAVALFAIENDISPEDARALEAIAPRLVIEFKTEEEINRVFLNGRDVTEAIRSPEVTSAVSPVSAHAGVREAMVARQREIARKGNVVAEGRDTTSVVFPEADIKVYLDASLKERARRRLIDFSRQGIDSTLEEQMALLAKRDEFDSSRSNSPLTRTGDSILIDTTNLNIEEQVDKIIKLITVRLMKK
ncbi:MAG: (d)CMP kinase [Candidatus Zixiibacteriota bacterium]|nr:MAG: (d)CMP kinase [candidate division Zixibacteria bacterium]HDL03504.1 (d)CMP kinase [candidate division Zixibacteria bacterium]